MWKIESALVPLDGTSHGKAALGVARSLINDASQTHLLHVLRELDPHLRAVLFPYSPLGEDEPAILDELRRNGARHIIDTLQLKDAQTEMLDVVFGNEPDQILEASTRRGVDLIVSSSHGASGARIDLGSVTSRILSSATVPVWISRALGSKSHVESILVATDLTDAASEVLDVACALAMKLGATLEVLTVIPDPFAQDDLELLKNSLRVDKKQIASKSKDRIDALYERALQKLQPAHPEKEKIAELLSRRRIVMGRPHEEIIRRAEGVDLVVIGRQSPGSGLMRCGSVAHAVARGVSSDVIVVPVDPNPTQVEDPI